MQAPPRIRHDIAVVIAELAGRQHGIVGRQQLLALGVGRGWIAHQLARARLHEVHRGVYAVGHKRLTLRGAWMAAVLAGGPDAVLSHRNAAALHEVRFTARAAVEITAPRRVARPRIHAHEARLPVDEVTVIDAIAVTTVSRTLLDLAAVLPIRHVERAMAEAEHRRLGDAVGLGDLLDRHPTAKGSGTLRALLRTREHVATRTRSELEEDFLAYVRRHGLPSPELNAHVEGRECDAVWRAARVVVELDSREFHHNHSAFGSDRLNSRRLTVAGWHPIRVAAEHLRTAELAGDLRSVLARVA